jgi:hypothetical protein
MAAHRRITNLELTAFDIEKRNRFCWASDLHRCQIHGD